MNFSRTQTLHSRFLFVEAPKFQKHYHSFLLQSHFLSLPLNASPLPLLSTTHTPNSWKSCRRWRHHRRVMEPETSVGSTRDAPAVLSVEEEEEARAEEIVAVESDQREEYSSDEDLWNQMVEVVNFSGPAVGLWLCGPLMSLIDTAVIGQGSSVELAALGPGTVFIDNTSYVFMFLSIATSNLVATSLARQDKDEVQHQISNLLFIGLACGVFMLVFTRLFGPWVLTAFIGAKNTDIIAASNTYVQIRGLAWPAILIGWIAQSSSLGMKDSWGPLNALAVASVINGIGDVVLCRVLDYGIAGAAWATMVSQVAAAYMMVRSLNDKGYNGFSMSIPPPNELVQIFKLAAPVFLTLVSKVAFYSLLVYFATSMGTHTVAAHQVMIQLYCMCIVWGEPLSQTAQSFMPELIYGANQSRPKARTLLKSLVLIGALSGLILGFIGTSVPWWFPKIFSHDPLVIKEMHKVLFPFFLALSVNASMQSLEGTLLAVRDLKFISSSMSILFSLGALLLLLLSSRGCGLRGCWFALVAFQWSLFSVALWRLTLPNGILYVEDLHSYQMDKLKVA